MYISQVELITFAEHLHFNQSQLVTC